MPQQTVFIVGGGGMVGATAAQVLAIKEIAHEIVLIDVAEDLVRGQAADLNHATAYTNGVHVRVGDYNDIKADDIIVITCGLPQKPGQSRLELVEANARIVSDVVTRVMAQGEPVFILMVSNPVDILTHVALKVSGLPPERVFGTGTTLDTARLRVTLANLLQVSPPQIQAYVLGEHGDSSFPALSSVNIGGVPIAAFPGFNPSRLETIGDDIRASAYNIIEAKKSTYYGIGQVVGQIVDALMRETANIFPVCSLARGEYGLNNVVIGLPSLISSCGVKILEGYPLNRSEQQQLQASAEIIKRSTPQV